MAGEQDLTVQDVAARMQVTPETVRRWLRTGYLQGYRLTRQAGWRVRPEDLDRLIQRGMALYGRKNHEERPAP